MLILKGPEIGKLLDGLTRDDALRLLNKLHETLQQLHSPTASKKIHQPAREVIVTEDSNTSLFMPCSITSTTAIKIVTVSDQGIKGCINVFSPKGELLGLLNAEQLTAFRTSLAVMIPFVRFPGTKADVLVFGAGKQAEWHIRLALLLSDDVKRITVVNRSTPRGMDELFETLKKKHPGVSFDVLLKTASDYDAQLQSRLKQADVLFCCTPATEPHFPHSYLDDAKPRFISLIGSYKPSMQEVDADTLLSGGKVFVDSKEDCLVEAGELIMAGVKEDQLVEVGDLEGYERELQSRKGNHVFKCVGFAIMDLLAAQEILNLAKEKGVGQDIGAL